MDLRTESLDFNVFQLFICLFLTADRLSPHEQLSRKYRLISFHPPFTLLILKCSSLKVNPFNDYF